MPASASSLHLDRRHRAMLAEMGIRVWQPSGADDTRAPQALAPAPARVDLPRPPQAARPWGTDAASPAQAEPAIQTQDSRQPPPSPVASVPTTTQPAVRPTPASAPALEPQTHAKLPDPSPLDWQALQIQLATAELAPEQPRVLSGHGDAQARWLFICDAPGSECVTLPQSGSASPAERLLDQMLRACGLSRQAGAYILYVHHSDDDGSLSRLWMQRVLQTLQPKVVVLMSRPATQSLLQTTEAPGRLRGQPLTCLDIPVVVSYPPALLLGKTEQKARAWADLCRARALAA